MDLSDLGMTDFCRQTGINLMHFILARLSWSGSFSVSPTVGHRGRKKRKKKDPLEENPRQWRLLFKAWTTSEYSFWALRASPVARSGSFDFIFCDPLHTKSNLCCKPWLRHWLVIWYRHFRNLVAFNAALEQSFKFFLFKTCVCDIERCLYFSDPLCISF